MSEKLSPLEILEKIRFVVTWENGEYRTLNSLFRKEIKLIETTLKNYETIKARLYIVKIKIDSMMKECVDIIEHTEEEAYMRTISETRYRTLQLVNDLLKEVINNGN